MADDAPAAPLNTTLRDVDGNYSSKRIAAFIALALFAAAMAVDTFTAHKVAQHFVDDLMVIVCSGLGLAVAERFAPRRGDQ